MQSDEKNRNTVALNEAGFNALFNKTGLTQYKIKDSAPLDPAEYLNLGNLDPLEPSPDSDFRKWLERAVQATRSNAHLNRASDWPLTFSGYIQAISKMDVIKRALFQQAHNDRPVYIPENSPELRRFVQKIYDSDRHARNFAGYVNYLGDVSGEFAQAIWRELKKATIHIPEAIRKEHTYIVGGTGSGKSELMKLLIHHYVAHPDKGAVLIIDPHGYVARQVARWREFSGAGSNRLVYLDANAKQHMNGLVPALNPIQRAGISDDDLPDLADVLADALAFLGGDGEGLTHHMQRLGSFGMQALLTLPDSTLDDLRSGLTFGKGSRLVNAGLRHPNHIVREHYERMFFSDSYNSARNGLAARLEGALMKPTFYRMMTTPNPFNLHAALDAGKVVSINCASAGANVSVLGRFIMAQVAGLGKSRLQNPFKKHMPVHVFVDEATTLISPPIFKILQELRKVGIHLTMVQQSFGQGLDREMRTSVKDNSALKLVGWNQNMTEIFKAMDWERGSFPKLQKREFIVDVRGNRMKLKPHSYLADDTNAMDGDEWEAVLEEQFDRYYRRPEAKNLPSPTKSDETWER